MPWSVAQIPQTLGFCHANRWKATFYDSHRTKSPLWTIKAHPFPSPRSPTIVREGVLRVTPSLLTLEVEGVRDTTTRQCNERQQRARPLVAEPMVHLNGEQHDTRREVLAADADAARGW